MKITMVEKERFELEYRYDEGYQYLCDNSIEYGIRNVDTDKTDDEGEIITEKHVVMYNRSNSFLGVKDLGTVEEFRSDLEQLAIEVKRLDEEDELDL